MTSPYSTGVVGTYPLSGVSNIDPLVWLGFKWGSDGAGTGATVSYSFPTHNASWIENYYDQEPFQNFQPFTAAQQTAAKQALALWSEVANVTFQQVTETPTNVGELRFGNSGAVTNSSSAAWAYTPYTQPGVEWPENGDIWFDKTYAPNLQLLPGKEGFATMLHEIGHAIGLDHPFDDGDGEPVLPANLDTDQYTVMTYTPELSTLAYASTPQLLDILAIQYIYGANMTTRTGNDTYKFSTSTEVNKTIWDAGGIDTLDFSNQVGFVDGALTEGTFFRFGGHPATATRSILGIAYGVTIENFIGSNYGNMIVGNDAANRLIGGNAADHFEGKGGDDHIAGGGGNDNLRGDGGSNWIDGGAGHDTVIGGDGVDTLFGGAGNDLLGSTEGDDFLDGGLGNDIMLGGAGNDTYVVSSIGDVINENLSGDSDDLIRSTISVSLLSFGSGEVEHAVLLGTAALKATGNGTDNKLTGNSAANVLDGGAGADTLTGGNGADIYTVDDAGDQVVETTAGTAGGIDLVNSSIDFTLGANVEKLTLTGLGNVDGTGNTLNNTIIGNNGANILDGSIGNDTLTGGKGSDTYIVDSAKDVVNETVLNSKGGGVDTVESSVTFSLATRTNIENLTLTGTGNINGTGNALANTIIGNSGNNILDGGTGADALKGGAGNDTYVLDNVGDTVDEGANTDTGDEVKTKALIGAAFAGVENYTYTGTKAWTFAGTPDANKISGGSANDTLNGGDGNDTLLGNGGNDTLIGEDGDDTLDGGAGNDKMKGGAGNDTYVINALTDSVDEDDNADTDDLVKSSVTVSLLSAGLLAIENVILTGATATNAIGNGADNDLTGNSGANKLDGGAGADTMTGGNGADTYTVDDIGDQVIETTGGAAGGIDLVMSFIDYTLGANVEKLTLTGTADIDGTGNSLNNTLIGNDGDNILDGGLGKDTMAGNKGDDYYFVDNIGDLVNETIVNGKGGGIDTVESSVTYSLAARVNVDHLILTGSGNFNGTGNALANEITGNLGNNILMGGAGNDILTGGDGKDKMTGGTGSDTFDFNLVSELGDGDTITDFKKGVGGDFLDISDLLVGYNDQFDEFVSFTYIGTATNVFVDADGLGGGFAAIQLANLSNVHLTNADSASFIVEVV